jgi:hypothetical protein
MITNKRKVCQKEHGQRRQQQNDFTKDSHNPFLFYHYTILYRQVNRKKPANLLRPDSMKTAHDIGPYKYD